MDVLQETRESRDRGLVRVVGPLGLAANVVNMVIGAGIFLLPAALAREIGAAAPLAYGACAIAIGAVALCFAEAGSRVPTSGGPYGYAEAAFGPFFGFVGMEPALGVSGEVRAPSRSVPLGLIGAMTAVTVIYIAIQIVAQGVLGEALPRSAAPLSDALAAASPGLAGFVLVGAAVSMSGYLAGNVFSAPRLLFAAARDGFLPELLAGLHPRTHAPTAAILVHVAVAAALALTGTFVELAVLSALVTAGIYILGCAAAVVLQRRRIPTAGEPLNFKATGVAALIGIAGMVWVAAQATVREDVSVAIALAVIGALYLAVRAGRNRKRA